MLAPNTILQNRYRIVRRIGQGGMGAVYEALHEELSHTVALKEILKEHTDDDSLRRAFKREARMLAGLRHPALPRVTDYFTEGDGLFLVMEHITGDDLMDSLSQQREPFPVPEVLRWADQLLDVLEYLHTQEPPVIHRDIKPSNIKLTERGHVILLDFGLAKGAMGEATSVVASRSVLGFTATYAPLEQIIKVDPNVVELLSVFGPEKIEHARQVGTDGRSDLYALGATLYHLLTKKQPAQSPTRALAVWSGRADPLRPASEVNQKVPTAVAAVLEKAMALESEDRPASAALMRRMMSEAMQPAPVKESEPVELAPTIVSPTIVSTQGDLPPTVLSGSPPPPTMADDAGPIPREPGSTVPSPTVASPAAQSPAISTEQPAGLTALQERKAREKAERRKQREEQKRKEREEAERKREQEEQEARREKMNKLMAEGSAAFDNKEYSVARQKWEEALRLFPDESSLKEAIASAQRGLEKERQLREAEVERKKQQAREEQEHQAREEKERKTREEAERRRQREKERRIREEAERRRQQPVTPPVATRTDPPVKIKQDPPATEQPPEGKSDSQPTVGNTLGLLVFFGLFAFAFGYGLYLTITGKSRWQSTGVGPLLFISALFIFSLVQFFSALRDLIKLMQK